MNPVVVKLFPEQFGGSGLLPFPAAFDDPRLSLISQTCTQDRIALRGLVYSTQPKRVLEIGRACGSSTVIIASALQHVPGSVFVSIDPNSLDEHSISPKLEESLKDRVTFIHGFSPAENARTFAAAQGRFDFVFIDGNHYYGACLKDILGVIPYLAEDAVILFHDAFFPGVEDAIAAAMETQPTLVDCGLVSTLAYYGSASQTYRGRPQVFGGIRMLRYRTRAGGSLAGPDAASLAKRVRRLEMQLAQVTQTYGGAVQAPRKRSFLKKLRRSIRKRMGGPPERWPTGNP